MRVLVKLFIWIFLLETARSERCMGCGYDMPYHPWEKINPSCYHQVTMCPDCWEQEILDEEEFFNKKLGIPYDTKTGRPLNG